MEEQDEWCVDSIGELDIKEMEASALELEPEDKCVRSESGDIVGGAVVLALQQVQQIILIVGVRHLLEYRFQLLLLRK